MDTSVLLDVLAPSPWREWSEHQLAQAAGAGDLAINQVIYAEIAVGFASQERMERTLQGVGLVRLSLPWAASWLVARAFLDYRSQGGPRTTPMPDFFIGAHAAAAGHSSRGTRSGCARTFPTCRWSRRSERRCLRAGSPWLARWAAQEHRRGSERSPDRR